MLVLATERQNTVTSLSYYTAVVPKITISTYTYTARRHTWLKPFQQLKQGCVSRSTSLFFDDVDHRLTHSSHCTHRCTIVPRTFPQKAHHVVNEHPYRWLLSLPPSSHAPCVLGLTAVSYSNDIGDARATASLAIMCDEFLITNTETATHEELEASGYETTGLAILPLPATITPPGAPPETDATFHRPEEIRGIITFSFWLMAWVCSTVAIAAGDAVRLGKLQVVESRARDILLGVQARHSLGAGVSSNGTSIPSPGALGAVILFVAQTNAGLEETCKQEPVSRIWVRSLSYQSALRKLQALGEAVIRKNIARRLAAARLVDELLDEVPT